MKRISILFILLLFFNPQIIQSQNHKDDISPLAEKFHLSLNGGIAYAETDFQRALTDYIIKGKFEYFFNLGSNFLLGVDADISQGYVGGDQSATPNLIRAESFRTRITLLGGGFSINYSFTDFFIPFIGAGINYLNFEPEIKDAEGEVNIPMVDNNIVNYSPSNITITGDVGLRFLISEKFILSLSGAAHFFPSDDLDRVPNEISNGTANDIFFTGTVGVGLLIGGVKDSDFDGVPDKLDACPKTPFGVKVDEFGCPVDSDGDGAADYLDECPDTPAGYIVDEKGCVIDTDGDGVSDDKDRCPYTPKGVGVNEYGCALDSDDDGVPDYLDECSDTPEGNYVNEFGCVLWVPDFDSNPKQKLVLYVDKLFTDEPGLNEFGKSEVGFIAKRLSESIYSEWAIVGHTDNVGDYMANRFLSLQWAKSIFYAFVDAGLDSTKLKFTGFGSEYPIASNTTEDGRSQNRRIEIFPIIDEQTRTKEPVKIEEKKPETQTVKPIIYGQALPYNYDNEKNVTDVILTDGRNYCIQLSTWRNKQRAEEVAAVYRAQGFNAFVTQTTVPNVSGYFHKVRVGFFESLSEVRQANQAVSEVEVK